MLATFNKQITAIQEARSAEERRRYVAYLLVSIITLFAIAFTGLHLFYGDTNGTLMLLALSGLLALLGYTHRKHSAALIGNSLTLVMVLLLCYFQWGLNGLYAPHSAWFSLAPILALLTAGYRWAGFWLLVTILFQVAVFVFHNGEPNTVSLWPMVSTDYLDIDALTVIVGQILALTLMVAAIERAREQTFQSLMQRNGELGELSRNLGERVEHELTVRLEAERAHEQEIEATQREVIITMGTICETRSRETGNHVRRVAEYSALLADLAGYSEREQELLRIASPMHDIGKVAIADEILNKPGKYTPEEFEVMKAHTTLGYEMLRGSNREIIQAAAIVAHQHHEKYDGSGYPQGLSGEAIHLYGRITAIADVFDALGSDRVYKKAWPLSEILEFFREQSGSHFDPALVTLFFDHLDRFLQIRERFKD